MRFEDDGFAGGFIEKRVQFGGVARKMGGHHAYQFICVAREAGIDLAYAMFGDAWRDLYSREAQFDWLMKAGNQMAALRPDLFKQPEGA